MLDTAVRILCRPDELLVGESFIGVTTSPFATINFSAKAAFDAVNYNGRSKTAYGDLPNF